MDGRQPRIARAWAVTSLGFEVIEECADQWCVEICDVQLAWLLASLFGGEAEQQPPGVAIRGDSAGTRVSLGYQTLREKRLECRGERAHGRSPRPSSRFATMVSSSGVACRYQ